MKSTLLQGSSHARVSRRASACCPTDRTAVPRSTGCLAPRSTRTIVRVSQVSLEQEVERLRAENAKLKVLLQKYNPSITEKEAESVINRLQEVAVTTTPSTNVDLTTGIMWPKAGEQFWTRAPRSSPAPLAGNPADVVAEKDSTPLHIVHITAEMAPIAKVGGLGDVVTGLAKSCLARGHNVQVCLPFYESLPKDQIEGLKHEMDIDVPKGYRWDGEIKIGSLRTSVFWGKIAGCPVYLIRPADWDACNIFRGGRIYGGSYNEMEAYLYFCRASLEFLKASGQQPHILQLHDWHAAAAALLYWEVYHQQGLWKPRLLLTIHNMDNTGEARQDEFSFTGVPGEAFASIDKALDERTIGHNPERINLMKGGIVYSNAVTTVSPSYGNDMINAGAAGWLKGLFAQDHVKSKFRGILNGIDTEDWDPARDPQLPANYSADTPGGKALCKEFLQRGLGLEVNPDKPLVVVVSRLVPQKGPHLIRSAIFRTIAKGGQFVLLGSGHRDPEFRALANNEFKDHPDCKLMIMYSEQLAHMMYGAADFVLVPSMFEPCGLTQLIALRYGALPVVRHTGGLADTVRDVDQHPADKANGFVFDGADEGSLFGALDRALAMYKDKRQAYTQLSLQAMGEDVSWSQSAKSYVQLYNSVIHR